VGIAGIASGTQPHPQEQGLQLQGITGITETPQVQGVELQPQDDMGYLS
jgi:hypothetical protein